MVTTTTTIIISDKYRCSNSYSLMFNLKVEMTSEPVVEPWLLHIARRIQLHTASKSATAVLTTFYHVTNKLPQTSPSTYI